MNNNYPLGERINHPRTHPQLWAVPEAIPKELPRTRVSIAIDTALDVGKVVFVTAPPGFGKTVAVAQWARSQTHQPVWLSCAQTKATSGTDRAVAGIPRATTGEQDRRTVFVVDDAQEHRPGHLRDLVESLLLGPASGARVIVVSRTPLAETLQGEAWAGGALLGAATLRLARDEIRPIAARSGVLLSAGESEWLHSETQGWPIAVFAILQEAALLRSHNTTPGGATETVREVSFSYLDEYVEQHILAGLGEGRAGAVLAGTASLTVTGSLFASLLATARGSGDDRVVGDRPDFASAMLESFRSLGLFLTRAPESPEEHGYLWEPPFAQACQRILRRSSPAQFARLHTVAAKHLAGQDPAVALNHAVRAGDWALVAGLLKRYWITMVLRGESSVADAACARLPEPWGDCAVMLAIRAGCREAAQDRVNAGFLLERAVRAAREQGTVDDVMFRLALHSAELLHQDDHGELSRICDDLSDLLASADGIEAGARVGALFLLARMETYLRRAPATSIELLQAASAEAELVGEPVIARRAQAALSFALAYGGEFRAATALCLEQQQREPLKEWYQAEGHVETFVDGFVRYWQYDLDGAASALKRTITVGGRQSSYASLARVYMVLTACARRDSRMVTEAAALLSKTPARELNGIPWGDLHDMATAVLHEARGETPEGTAIALRLSARQCDPVIAAITAETLRLLGNTDRAGHLASSLMGDRHVPYVSVSAALTRAAIEWNESRHASAHSLLEAALGLGSAERIRRPFHKPHADWDGLLLAHLQWGSAFEPFLREVIQSRSRTTLHLRSPEQALSGREEEVLALMRTTLTRREIAQALFVTENTVKTHQKSIYRKLGVAGRQAAVDASRQ